MNERNVNMAKGVIVLRPRFNERDKKAKEKWHMNKGRWDFHNFCRRES